MKTTDSVSSTLDLWIWPFDIEPGNMLFKKFSRRPWWTRAFGNHQSHWANLDVWFSSITWAKRCLNTSIVGELTLLFLKIAVSCVLSLVLNPCVLSTAGGSFHGARLQMTMLQGQFSIKNLELDWWYLSHWHGQGYTLYLDSREARCHVWPCPFLVKTSPLCAIWCM